MIFIHIFLFKHTRPDDVHTFPFKREKLKWGQSAEKLNRLEPPSHLYITKLTITLLCVSIAINKKVLHVFFPVGFFPQHHRYPIMHLPVERLQHHIPLVQTCSSDKQNHWYSHHCPPPIKGQRKLVTPNRGAGTNILQQKSNKKNSPPPPILTCSPWKRGLQHQHPTSSGSKVFSSELSGRKTAETVSFWLNTCNRWSRPLTGDQPEAGGQSRWGGHTAPRLD